MARHTRNATLTPWIVTALATTLTGVAGCTPDAASARETHAPAPGAAGIGDTLHPGLGNAGYTVRHTALAPRFAEDLTTYTATTTLHGRATRSLSRFHLDLTGTTVRSVTVDGRKATWTRSGQELRVTPPAPVPSGRGFSVEVTVRAPVAGPEAAGKLGTSAIGMVRAKGVIQTINQRNTRMGVSAGGRVSAASLTWWFLRSCDRLAGYRPPSHGLGDRGARASGPGAGSGWPGGPDRG
ncbi:M1 family metallopeptidase [Streptomyces violaceusniger]